MFAILLLGGVVIVLVVIGFAFAPRLNQRHRRICFECCEDRAMLTLPYVFISAHAVETERDQIQVYVGVDPASAEVISVDFTITTMVADRVATPGEDYSLHGAPAGVYSGTITFAPEEIECEFFIDVVDDIPYEGREWLRISLSNPVNAQFVNEYELLHDSSNADTFIEDNEDPYIVITAHDGALEPLSAEGTSYALFDVELLGGDEYTSAMPVVSWTTTTAAGDTATAGLDFQSSSGTVTPILDDEPVTIQVPLIYDGSGESEETLRVSLTSATNGITIMVAEAVATVFDAFALAADGPPPDGQFGPIVGRTLTAVASDKGNEFWEGEEVTFTRTFSSPTPMSGESIVYYRRPLKYISAPAGQAEVFHYGPWEWILPTSEFDEPFIGQVRVTLTSGDTVSSKAINVRAKAAYPIGLTVVSSGRVGDHLQVDYTVASSSGRPEDLDGVKIGEFIWFTEFGYRWGTTLKGSYQFKSPPFAEDYTQGDGMYFPSEAGVDA
ncbi:MAG: hypothetical protein L0211_22325, partial [Planctomycetaceae bacterium]|nr:hypothetical protein [Planctomycetaceae bacterium]